MPLMHSEALADQEVRRGMLGLLPAFCEPHVAQALPSRLLNSRLPLPLPLPTPLVQECVARFEALQAECAAAGLDKVAEMAGGNVKYASAHRDCVAQWGRFPHRNAILGRPNTPEEAAGIAAGTIPKW